MRCDSGSCVRNVKEPGGPITQSPKYEVHKQVRRPRLPLHGGMFKGVTQFQGWVQPHRPKIYVPRVHAGITIGQDGKRIVMNGGLRRIKIPCQPRDLMPTVVTTTRYRHTIDATVAKISEAAKERLEKSDIFGRSSPKSRRQKRREAEVARQRAESGSPSTGRQSRGNSRGRPQSRSPSRGNSRLGSRPAESLGVAAQ